MKSILIFSLWLGLFIPQEPIHPKTQRVLKGMIEMQNTGTDTAINHFIDTYFHPEVLAKMENRPEHVAFYRQIINDFGQVQSEVYKVEVSTATKLKVQLVKEGVALVPEPSPEEILVVEIDLNKQAPNFLDRGLGMGALICYIKR